MTGNELKERRKKLGLSQEKLGQQLGVTGGSVARWEQLGEQEIPSPMLDLALEALEKRQAEEANKKS